MADASGLLGELMKGSTASGRSLLALVFEAVCLRTSAGRIGVSEYLDFRLYENDLTLAEKRAFGGWRAQAVLEEILVDDYSRFLSLDKITMYSLLKACGFPIPELRAVYGTIRPAGIAHIESSAALQTFLRAPGSLPVYMKPSLGSYGRGNALIRRLDGDSLVLGSGNAVPVKAFCESLHDAHGLGWILQEPLTPHPRIAELCGERISGVRVHTFLTRDGPRATRAIWKINVGTEDSDNFRHGASGNMLGALDLDTGRVTRVVSGKGPAQVVNPLHPVSGMKLEGFQVPRWSDVKSLVCEAHKAFPGYVCPGWDVAICEDGPKILEVNFFGDIDLSQHAARRGFQDPDFLRLMRDRGLDHLPSSAAHRWLRSKRNGRLGRRKHHWSW
jgi:hypothetical protein